MTIVKETIDNSYIEFMQINVVEINRERKITIKETKKTIYKKYFKVKKQKLRKSQVHFLPMTGILCITAIDYKGTTCDKDLYLFK